MKPLILVRIQAGHPYFSYLPFLGRFFIELLLFFCTLGSIKMSKLIVVSNRLPVTLSQQDKKLAAKISIGGLAQNLEKFLLTKKMDYLWIGWPGGVISESKKVAAKNLVWKKYQAVPVFFTQQEQKEFYEGFCNEIIWPLFHYFPNKCRFDDDYWQAYRVANQRFADQIIKNYQPGDLIFIQDYQLMLVPQLVREKIPNAEIIFFLHIPFPAYEIFRILPSTWRVQILEGLLGADLIGMHTDDYGHYFLDSVLRILGFTHSFGTVLYNNRLVKTQSFPLGINYESFAGVVQEALFDLKQIFAGKKIIISIDRLDYTKGIYNRLQAFSYFLDHYPDYHHQVSLILIAVPSRTKIPEYKEMRSQISRLVSEINGRYGTIGWLPITYQLRSFSQEELVALYQLADICLVTPLRDGMNLVAKEYVASLQAGKGVLILSELTGAAKELRQALLVNPNSIAEMGQAIATALAMPESEQIWRNTEMQSRLKKNTSSRWFEEIFQEMKKVKTKYVKQTSLLNRGKSILNEKLKKSSKRLIFLDYDGTLSDFAPKPELAEPNERILKLLSNLAKNRKNRIVIISGRDQETMETWFGGLKVMLVAEHGAITRINGKWQNAPNLTSEWKPLIRPILQKYSERVKKSFIEEKAYALAWHYRRSKPEEAKPAANELKHELLHLIANMNIQVLEGSKVLEVKNAGINKGAAVRLLVENKPGDFIFAAGDDVTDEEMFAVLRDQESALTVKIGSGSTKAKYRLANPSQLYQVLQQLAIS